MMVVVVVVVRVTVVVVYVALGERDGIAGRVERWREGREGG